MSKRRRVIRSGHALPNEAEHQMAESRLLGATAKFSGRAASPEPVPEAVPEPGPAIETQPEIPAEPKAVMRPKANDRPRPQRAPKTNAAPEAPPATKSKKKKNIRGFVVWLPAEVVRLKRVAKALGITVSYLEKALLKKASARYLALDHAKAVKDSPRLASNLDLRRAEGAGGFFANAYSDPDLVRSLRRKVNDPLDLISDARIIGATFRVYALDILTEFEKDLPE